MAHRSRSNRPSLIIRNLPLDTRKSEVEDLFNRFGDVRDVYLPLNHYTRRFQGFGFVEFHHMRDAEDAQEELDNKLFGGRTLEVKWSRDDRKTPREMIRRESDQPGRDRGPPRRRRSFSPGYRSPGPSRRDRDRSPGGYRSPPPRSPARSPIRSGDRDGSPPRSKRSPDRREYSGSPPLD